MEIDRIINNQVFSSGLYWTLAANTTIGTSKQAGKFNQYNSQLLQGFAFTRSSQVLAINLTTQGLTTALIECFDQLVIVEQQQAAAQFASQAHHSRQPEITINARIDQLDFITKFDLIFVSADFFAERQFDSAYSAAKGITNLNSLLAADGMLIIADNHKHQLSLSEVVKASFKHTKIFHLFSGKHEVDKILADEFLGLKEAKEIITGITSNEHLIFAHNARTNSPQVENLLGLLYNFKRLPRWQTCTRLLNEQGRLQSFKARLNPQLVADKSDKLAWVASNSDWQNGYSLHNQILQACHNAEGLADVFRCCLPWLEKLKFESDKNSNQLPWHYLDCIWSNTYYSSEGVVFIDQEWRLSSTLNLHTLLIRSIYQFLDQTYRQVALPTFLRRTNWRQLITEIAQSLNVNLTSSDFLDFIELESTLRAEVQGLNKKTTARNLRLQLSHSALYCFLRTVKLKFTF